ncbi:DUF55-domain-containing protein [Gymnopus androsaceus JB14]|uniref:DUF55-domain-containing protein n=1 Tax=Gymnopus androsaceus JB14 TaxID=1447944 RepID=A0A6A4I9J4_9AGAR|nr:DUF55-domain-containing protein [Gymnopus androsaceus JB14]
MVELYWLLKAEPDSRIVKGKDVKFSIDDFESVKTSPWEGVRNYEARNLMKTMKALFYHSNCKNPGIAAFAKVSKEAYPDYTAWDPSHPYYDQKSDKSSPKWFMVDLTFDSRANHFIPLALLKHISEKVDNLPENMAYIGSDGAKAIKSMDLINRGRLSIQRVQKPAWDAISLLAERGGWDVSKFIKKTSTKRVTLNQSPESGSVNTRTRSGKKTKEGAEDEDQHAYLDAELEELPSSESEEEDGGDEEYGKKPRRGKASGSQKRKAVGTEHPESRPSTRARTRK